jgi:hypothetical protein
MERVGLLRELAAIHCGKKPFFRGFMERERGGGKRGKLPKIREGEVVMGS